MPDEIIHPSLTEYDAISVEEQALSYFDALLQQGQSEGAALQAAVTRYPAQAGLLSDHATLLAVMEQPSTSSGSLEAMVESAAARLAGTREQTVLTGILERVNATGRTIEELCKRLHIGRSMLTKLERRVLDVSTIPTQFLRSLAAELTISVDALRSYLAAPPQLSRAAEFKSRSEPKAGAKKQSFEQAVKAAVTAGEISESDQGYWEQPGEEAEP